MLRFLLVFAVFICGILLLLVYFVGNYSINLQYLTGLVMGKPPVERDLVLDDGSKNKSFYHLKVTTRGLVEFQTDDGVNRDFRTFKIEDNDLKTIRNEMEKTNIFQVFTLDRTYCFDRWTANMNFDFGWMGKNIKYSNCKDDPSEIVEFRHFLYNFLGLSLKGT